RQIRCRLAYAAGIGQNWILLAASFPIMADGVAPEFSSEIAASAQAIALVSSLSPFQVRIVCGEGSGTNALTTSSTWACVTVPPDDTAASNSDWHSSCV